VQAGSTGHHRLPRRAGADGVTVEASGPHRPAAGLDLMDALFAVQHDFPHPLTGIGWIVRLDHILVGRALRSACARGRAAPVVIMPARAARRT
jgi:hypothetical protein